MQLTKENSYFSDSIYCPRIWDGIMCWPQTEAGRIATQPCPYYINKFKRNGNDISVQNTYEILFF
jgi:hypothetical protein